VENASTPLEPASSRTQCAAAMAARPYQKGQRSHPAAQTLRIRAARGSPSGREPSPDLVDPRRHLLEKPGPRVKHTPVIRWRYPLWGNDGCAGPAKRAAVRCVARTAAAFLSASRPSVGLLTARDVRQGWSHSRRGVRLGAEVRSTRRDAIHHRGTVHLAGPQRRAPRRYSSPMLHQ
jgi:hypothetical protein